ncbi:putative RNA-directed DNA polymerase from transposon X-element [Aspergillus affinis]|uniref:putative RNA-directed DNA polymerase from transposon X-element n=1 Tax=Aspergillus affinis TaxID=1070780 RepID=UPI0022FDBB93|nr:putative RNA-directed DNA polymerase from transposon X-element [Aspergillus affinis]KAI9044910.1 putative RNA-directed DNA polymerase from transposon X-element [Aspergillus affinis]
MVGAKTPWPALSGIPEATNSLNQNFLTCVLNLHVDAKSFISHNEQAGKQLPKPVIENAHLGPELASIKQTLQNVQQHTHSTQSSIRNQSHKSWASVVKNAPPPAHTISSHGSSSTAPATPSEPSKDREVIVKLRDVGAQKTYRKKSSAEIKDKAANARKRAAAAIPALSLARARFVSARQLCLGDLSLALRTAAEAETARIYDKWADFMSSGATLRRPTWGVVVHGIPIKSIQDLSDQGEQDRVARELLDENREVWSRKPDIKRVAWLSHLSNHKNRKSSALTVEFSDPSHANEAIMKGTIWASDSRITVLYDRNARIRRCFKCQQYGHIEIVCSNKTTCGLCTEGHETRSCVQRSATGGQGRKCGEAHAAWSRACTSRPTERNRSTVRFQEGSTPPHSSQELVSVQQEEALIDLNPEMDVDPIPSESEPSLAQQIDTISEPETPAPVTPAPRGRTLSKRRPRSVISSEATRRSARHQVAQEAVGLASSPATGDTPPAKRTRSKQPIYRERSVTASDITSDS